MRAYFDSAVIVKLYVQEANSPDAVALVSAQRGSCPLTPWQEIEVRTAMCLKAFRGEITAEELRNSLGAFDEDIRLGRWRMPAYEGGGESGNWPATYPPGTPPTLAAGHWTLSTWPGR